MKVNGVKLLKPLSVSITMDESVRFSGFLTGGLPLKMLYLIGPDGLVNLRFVNFQNMVWMTMVHVLRFRI